MKALQQKKLFILDYNDLLLPYVEKVRQLEGTTLYGSRTLFFLSSEGTLRPLVIELTRPPMNGQPQWKQAFQPSWQSTEIWLWRLAIAHVLAHDSGYHQLVSHWYVVTLFQFFSAASTFRKKKWLFDKLHSHWQVKNSCLHRTLRNCYQSASQRDASNI